MKDSLVVGVAAEDDVSFEDGVFNYDKETEHITRKEMSRKVTRIILYPEEYFDLDDDTRIQGMKIGDTHVQGVLVRNIWDVINTEAIKEQPHNIP